MSTLTVKELSAPTGEVIKIAAGKTLDLNSQGTLILPTVPSAKMPTGSVIQVVNMTDGTNNTSSSNSWAESTITLNITPQFSSSKILVQVHIVGANKSNNTYLGLRLLRVNPNAVLSQFENQFMYNAGTGQESGGGTGITYLDSPNSTNALTYKVQFRSGENTSNAQFNIGGTSSMTLQEIQG